MDLAMELGAGSVHALTTRMPATEFADWLAYSAKRLLPMRRIEMYLAQIAQVTAGGKLADYLLRPAPESVADGDDAEVGAGVFAAVSGGNVHVLNVPRHPMQDQLDKFDREQAAKRRH